MTLYNCIFRVQFICTFSRFPYCGLSLEIIFGDPEQDFKSEQKIKRFSDFVPKTPVHFLRGFGTK